MARGFWCQESDSEWFQRCERVLAGQQESSPLDPSRGDIVDTLNDQAGDTVFTQVRESEPDCVQLAAIHHTAYLAKGWEPAPEQPLLRAPGQKPNAARSSPRPAGVTAAVVTST